MKRIALTVSVIFIALFCASGCALKAQGYGVKPSDVKPVYVQQQQAPTQNSAIENKMDAMIAELRNLSSAIQGNGKTDPAPAKKAAKKPKPGIFGQNAKKQPAVAVAPSGIPIKKAATTKSYVSAACVAEMKNRIARLEDINSDKGAGSIYFQPAKSCLCSSITKTWLENNIVARWFNGEIDITKINGYASMSKPKNPNITNMDYAKQRAIAVKQYLISRGIKLDGVKINVKGPTNRFGNNLNVTVVWNEIQNESEQKTKKEERKQYKVGP